MGLLWKSALVVSCVRNIIPGIYTVLLTGCKQTLRAHKSTCTPALPMLLLSFDSPAWLCFLQGELIDANVRAESDDPLKPVSEFEGGVT